MISFTARLAFIYLIKVEYKNFIINHTSGGK